MKQISKSAAKKSKTSPIQWYILIGLMLIAIGLGLTLYVRHSTAPAATPAPVTITSPNSLQDTAAQLKTYSQDEDKATKADEAQLDELVQTN